MGVSPCKLVSYHNFTLSCDMCVSPCKRVSYHNLTFTLSCWTCESLLAKESAITTSHLHYLAECVSPCRRVSYHNFTLSCWMFVSPCKRISYHNFTFTLSGWMCLLAKESAKTISHSHYPAECECISLQKSQLSQLHIHIILLNVCLLAKVNYHNFTFTLSCWMCVSLLANKSAITTSHSHYPAECVCLSLQKSQLSQLLIHVILLKMCVSLQKSQLLQLHIHIILLNMCLLAKESAITTSHSHYPAEYVSICKKIRYHFTFTLSY